MTPERELREALIHTALVLEGNAEYWLGLPSEDSKHHGRWLANIAEECRAKAAAPAPTPAPLTNVRDDDIFKLACKLVDTASKDRKTFWLPVLSQLCKAVIAQEKEIDSIMSRPAEPVVPEREPLKRGDEVWIRGKVMCVFSDEISVAPYAHRNAGGSVAVKFENCVAAAPRAAGGQCATLTAKHVLEALRYALPQFVDHDRSCEVIADKLNELAAPRFVLTEEQVRDSFDDALEGGDEAATINYKRFTQSLNDAALAAAEPQVEGASAEPVVPEQEPLNEHELLVGGVVRAALELAILRGDLRMDNGASFDEMSETEREDVITDTWNAMNGEGTCEDGKVQELTAIYAALAAAPRAAGGQERDAECWSEGYERGFIDGSAKPTLRSVNNHGLFEFRGVNCPFCGRPIALYKDGKGGLRKIVHIRHISTNSSRCELAAAEPQVEGGGKT